MRFNDLKQLNLMILTWLIDSLRVNLFIRIWWLIWVFFPLFQIILVEMSTDAFAEQLVVETILEVIRFCK